MDKNSSIGKHMIEKAKKIALFGHISPDGDCIGAMLGLGKLLEKQKKNVSYFVPNKPSKIFDFVKHIKRLKSRFDYKKYDLLIFVDFTGFNRMGIISQANPEYFKDKPILIFDHHPDNGVDHGVLIKDVKSISTCEILFEQTHKRWPKLYDKDIATYFYLGITSDSGNFMFEKDHIRTFTNVLNLLKLEADKDLIVNNFFRKKSLNSVKFLQLLLGRIQEKDQLLYTYYDENELEEYNIDTEEAAYALHIIQNIDGPEIVLFIRKIGDIVKGSLRTKKIDCNRIANGLGGGGHKLAAGFSLPVKGKFEQQIKEIVKFIIEMAKTEH
ncbi:MAG: bifunctional oligoribonuclease/PAP phosphatase NrnA [candidate division SR1 bacterium]|nr:bifunctional oligoribonuclease/PAP phosphatase NrnA [candidate division SR1 bacterium]